MIFLNGMGVPPRAERAETERPPRCGLCGGFYKVHVFFGPQKRAPNAIFTSFHISWLVQLHIICVSIRIYTIYMYICLGSEKNCRLSPVSKWF